MAQATFEVQTFDGHGWVTRHRGADVDAAGEAARRVLPDAKRHAVRIVKQVYDPAQQKLDNQVVFSLGTPRRRNLRRMVGAAAALALSAAAIAGAAVLPSFAPDALAELADAMVTESAPVAAAQAPVQVESEAMLATLTPAAGTAPDAGFDCRREAATGLIRATNIAPERDRLYQLCAAAVAGDATAQAELATRLAAGDGTPSDPSQAVEWLQESARAGHGPAYLPLADLLMDVDPARAVSWYHRAASAGDVDAARTLASLYRSGTGVEQDARIALSYELMAADAGDAEAMVTVASAFEAGDGTETNPEAAQRWRERAAAAGAAPADVAEGQPTLQWTPPAGDSVPQASWAAPAETVAQLLTVPPLTLDIDQPAQEVFTAFASGSLASV